MVFRCGRGLPSTLQQIKSLAGVLAIDILKPLKQTERDLKSALWAVRECIVRAEKLQSSQLSIMREESFLLATLEKMVRASMNQSMPVLEGSENLSMVLE
jgi:hypothetical protein